MKQFTCENGKDELYSLTASTDKTFKDKSILGVNELNPSPKR